MFEIKKNELVKELIIISILYSVFIYVIHLLEWNGKIKLY